MLNISLSHVKSSGRYVKMFETSQNGNSRFIARIDFATEVESVNAKNGVMENALKTLATFVSNTSAKRQQRSIICSGSSNTFSSFALS